MIIGSFGPFVAALVVARATGEWDMFKARLFRWRVSLRWYLLVLALPVTTFALAYGTHLVLGGAPFDATRGLPLTALPGVFLVTLLVGGGNEEPGWRGYALDELEARFGPLTGTLILGALWALWHFPAFLDPASSQNTVPLLAWMIGVFLNTIVLTWLFNHTQSIIIAALYHAFFNVVGIWPATAMPLEQFARLYWIAVLLYGAFVIALLLATRATLGFTSQPPLTARTKTVSTEN
ncbi:CPBP family intramembrane glutamic endopeptidase [Haloprofundus salinisoli]|uniref:CPBP family intramembrane glutamic endopeptidase n=1 Tax=Haloprofundus salinisoli TaxID=2876193 RepID=UPI001CCB9BE9|nr:CPBP family intramembrane glutamic endopeptidase [Haloprofundus salinisoli]